MALIFTGTDTNGFIAPASGDTIVTREGRTVSNVGDAVAFGVFDSIEYFVQGDVFATDDGITASSGANNISVAVGLGASVMGAGDGIEFLGNPTADSGHRVTNDGSIIGESGEGVDIRGQSSQVTNNGFISGAGFGVFVSGASASVFNHGTIAGNSNGVGVSGDRAELFNHGTVTAGSDGLEITGDDAQLVNHGTVTAGATGLSLLGTGSVINTGTVTGDVWGVRMAMSAGEAARFVNTGTVTNLSTSSSAAAVDGSSGNETVINHGTLVGDVVLEGGNDVYDGRHGSVSGTVFGGVGGDRLIGGDGDEVLNGGDGFDALRGKDGEDSLSGGNGNDDVRGGHGDDTIFGGQGNDSLWGGKDDDGLNGDRGNDLLMGGEGDDRLSGGNGSDTLHGGKDDDALTGGAGGDVFVFQRDAGNDVITDYTDGVDLIDVSAFGLSGFGQLSTAISFSGGDAFIDWGVFGGEGLLTIDGAAIGLNAADFVF